MQLRHLFKSLKALAFGMLVAGIILVVIISYMDLTPGLEFAILLFFGFAGGLYLIARGKSILLQHQLAEERYRKGQDVVKAQDADGVEIVDKKSQITDNSDNR